MIVVFVFCFFSAGYLLATFSIQLSTLLSRDADWHNHIWMCGNTAFNRPLQQKCYDISSIQFIHNMICSLEEMRR